MFNEQQILLLHSFTQKLMITDSTCITIIIVVIVVIGLGYAQDQDLDLNYIF